MIAASLNRSKFLRAILPERQGYAHLLAIPHNGTQVRDTRCAVDAHTDIESFVAHNQNCNLYVGIAARGTSENGRLENCATLAALFAEIDLKDYGGNEEVAKQKLEAFALKPSITVASGGGWHCYWLLKTPLTLASTGAALARRLLRALARAVGADLKAAEPARILRLPDTTNFKYDPPRTVRIETFEPSRSYALEEIQQAVPADDEETYHELTIQAPAPVEHDIPEQQRLTMAISYAAAQRPAVEGQGGDNWTYQVCCSVAVGHDLSADQAFTALCDWNARCSPPWSEQELRNKIHNAIQYSKGSRGELIADAVFERHQGGRLAGQIVANSQRNIKRAFRRLGIKFRYDAFASVTLIGQRDIEKAVDDSLLNRTWLGIDETFQFRPSMEFFLIVAFDLARQRWFHPVRDYLASLEWDGKPRLDLWLTTYGGAVDGPLTRAMACKPLIAAVRRVRQPGAKFDELLILESSTQGTEKSSAVKALCPWEEWFSDDMPLGVDSKQVIERTSGKWIVEAAELHGYTNSQVDKLKSMLSRQVDGPVRLAYAKTSVEVPRQFIAIGTTNEVTDYLRDSTGNRRFWPIRIVRFDVDSLRRDRDQLWAEATHREAAGESIRLDEELWPLAAQEQEARRAIDPWEDLLDDRDIDFASNAVLVQDLWKAIGDAGRYQKKNDADRLSKIMQRRGFTRRKKVDLIRLKKNGQRWVGTPPRRAAWIKDGADPSEVIVEDDEDDPPF